MDELCRVVVLDLLTTFAEWNDSDSNDDRGC